MTDNSLREKAIIAMQDVFPVADRFLEKMISLPEVAAYFQASAPLEAENKKAWNDYSDRLTEEEVYTIYGDAFKTTRNQAPALLVLADAATAKAIKSCESALAAERKDGRQEHELLDWVQAHVGIWNHGAEFEARYKQVRGS